MKAIICTMYFGVGSLMLSLAPLTTCSACMVFLAIVCYLGILFESKRFWKWYISRFDRREH